MKEFKLIIAGGRDYADYEQMKAAFLELYVGPLRDYKVSIVSGMARGADALAVRLAREYRLPLHEFPANWDAYGKSAGYRRNEQMADFADGLLAFWDTKSRGTKHMIDIANRRDMPVRVVTY